MIDRVEKARAHFIRLIRTAKDPEKSLEVRLNCCKVAEEKVIHMALGSGSQDVRRYVRRIRAEILGREFVDV